MRIGAFMYHTFSPPGPRILVFSGQVGMRIGGLVNILPFPPE